MNNTALCQSEPLNFQPCTSEELRDRALASFRAMRTRRTVRDFSDRPVARGVIESCIATAGLAPSGANQQPWHFVAISDVETKRAIRQAAEQEEQAFYGGRAPDEWLDALAHLGTDADKPFLEQAPWLVVVFAQRWGSDDENKRVKHYYVPESVGIACGFLIASIHQAGLSCLTHTPAPMTFLSDICRRPSSEKPYLILVVGHPQENARVPVIAKKSLNDISSWI